MENNTYIRKSIKDPNEIMKNNYSILLISPIIGSLEKKTINNENFIPLFYGGIFKIQLTNYNSSYAQAYVWWNGEIAGVWTLKPHERIIIDRTQNNGQQFVYNSDGLYDMIGSSKISLIPTSTNIFQNGNIIVIFKKEITSSYLKPVNIKKYKKYNKINEKSYGINKIKYDKMPICSDYNDFPECNSYINKYNNTSYNKNRLIEDLTYDYDKIIQIGNKELFDMYKDKKEITVIEAQITRGYESKFDFFGMIE